MQPVGLNFFFETPDSGELEENQYLITQLALVLIGCVCYLIFKEDQSKKDLKTHVIEWLHTRDQADARHKIHIASEILNAAGGACGLRICCSKIFSLPTFTPELQTLTVLEISNTRLIAPPYGIEHLQNLKKLFLDRNQLQKLSKELFQLKNLEVLSVNQNSLRKLPDLFYHLQNLEIFSAQKNLLKYLPSSLSALERLKILLLSENQLQESLLDFTELSSLVTVDLSGNVLNEIPKTLLQESLIALNLATNRIKMIPDEIEKATNLKVLRISENFLDEISGKIGVLVRLESLDLCLNLLKRLPPEMGNLSSLKRLNLVANLFLTELPLSFCGLSNLEQFNFELTPIPYDQIVLICSRINGTFQADAQTRFTKMFAVWARLAKVSDLEPAVDLTPQEKEMCVDWMIRLEATVDFSRQTDKLTRLCVEMMQFLHHKPFKTEFFVQLEHNLTGCEDRSLLNLLLLNLIFQKHKIADRPIDEQFFLLCSSAKTLEVLKRIPDWLFFGQEQVEDTELYLLVLEKLHASLQLLLPFPIHMRYLEFAHRQIKEEIDWSNFFREIASKDLIDLIFFHIPDQAHSFLNTHFPQKTKEIEEIFAKKLEDFEAQFKEKKSKIYFEQMQNLSKQREAFYKGVFKEISLSFTPH